MRATNSIETTFRPEIREWIAANRVPELTELASPEHRSVRLHLQFGAWVGGDGPLRQAWETWVGRNEGAGFVCPWWPTSAGGRGWDPVQQMIWTEELAFAQMPRVTRGLGEHLVGPAVFLHGTDEQKDRFLPPILDGQDTYIQGFSEPDAGSDLASLRTTGVVDGDEVVITGQKIWTTVGLVGNRMFVLCRTDPAAPPHKGISYVLIDLEGNEQRGDAPDATDDRRSRVHRGVPRRRPGSAVERDRWAEQRLAGDDVDARPRTGRRRDDSPSRARADGARRTRLHAVARPRRDPRLRQDLIRSYIDVELMRFGGLRVGAVIASAIAGDPGMQREIERVASANKLIGAEVEQRIADLAIRVQGADRADPSGRGRLPDRYLAARVAVVACAHDPGRLGRDPAQHPGRTGAGPAERAPLNRDRQIPTMIFDLSDDERALRDLCATFAQREIKPVAARAWEEERCPTELLRAMGELGLLGVLVPEKWGGIEHVDGGLRRRDGGDRQRRPVGRVGVASTRRRSGRCPLLMFGTDDQRERWLRPLAEGTALGAFGLTEPDAGSDVRGISTRARRGDGGWVINGRKAFISNAGTDMSYGVALLARTGEDSEDRPFYGNFIVEKDTPGFTMGNKMRGIGWKGLDTRELYFDDVWVPDDQVLGDPALGLDPVPQHAGGRADLDRRALGQPGQGGARHVDRVRPAATPVRTSDRRLPGDPVQARRHRDGARSVEAAHLLRRIAARPGAAVPQGGRDGEDEGEPDRDVGRIGGSADPRRARLHAGEPGRPLLLRRQGAGDRRGHERDPAPRDRAVAALWHRPGALTHTPARLRAARSMSLRSMSQSFSSDGAYGAGDVAAPRRTIGASRCQNSSAGGDGGDLGADAEGDDGFVGDEQPAGAAHRGEDRVVVERRDRSEVDDLELDPLGGQGVGRGEAFVHHAGDGHHRHVLAGADDARLAERDEVIRPGAWDPSSRTAAGSR